VEAIFGTCTVGVKHIIFGEIARKKCMIVFPDDEQNYRPIRILGFVNYLSLSQVIEEYENLKSIVCKTGVSGAALCNT